MSISAPINFKKWIEDNRHLLKPPVGNKCMYNGDYIVMIVGGPNSRKDFHYNETPEFYYQVEGDITVKVIDDGIEKDINIKEGEMFVLPAGVPHSPQRGPNTIGLVIESKRPSGMEDALEWYCENCGHKLYREQFALDNIETDLPKIFDHFYETDNASCEKCNSMMQRPQKL